MKKYEPVTMNEGNGSTWVSMEESIDGGYVKAEVAEKLREALKEMVSIAKIAQAEYRENFAWAELAYAEEVLNYSEEN